MEPGASSTDDLFLLRTYAASADPAAFAELVRRYADMVYATARRVTGNPTAAEDVAQDCFLRLAQSSSAVSGSLAAWLHRTSLNRSLEFMRSERARHQREQQVAAAGGPRESAAELIANVDLALAALPDELREVVAAHFLCGQGQKEIAARLGVSQPTVSRRIERGLEQLRKWLADNGMMLAVAAMPAYLRDAASVHAPSTVQLALTKIGLAGVRPAPPAAAATSYSATVFTITAAAAVLVVSASVWFALRPAPARPTPAAVSVPSSSPTQTEPDRDRDIKLSLDQVPQAARNTLVAQAQGAVIDKVDKDFERGRTVYEIDVRISGRLHEIRVAENGTLLSNKPE